MNLHIHKDLVCPFRYLRRIRSLVSALFTFFSKGISIFLLQQISERYFFLDEQSHVSYL